MGFWYSCRIFGACVPIMLVILIVACFKGVVVIWVVIFVHYTFTIILGAFFSVDMWNVSSPESMHEGTMPPFERKAPRASNGIPRVTSPWMLVVCFLFAEKWERCQDLVRVLPLILVMIPLPVLDCHLARDGCGMSFFVFPWMHTSIPSCQEDDATHPRVSESTGGNAK